MSALRHAFVEALSSLWRGRRLAMLATLTIATAVFVLGCFLLVTVNLERVADEWRSAAELSVFLADDVTADDRRRIETLLTPGPVVTGFEFVSKADALARFKEMFGDMAPTVDALGGNPLPASYEVRLAAGAESPGGVDALEVQLRKSPGVTDVRYDRQWLERLRGGVTVVGRVGLLLGALLALAAALTATTVIRLALHARRDELEIMELVGSPRVFVQGPFIMEGTLQGVMGGLMALGALFALFVGLRAKYLGAWASALNVTSMSFLPLGTCAILVLGATAVGCISGVAASRSRR